jgi:hypothetical protein
MKVKREEASSVTRKSESLGNLKSWLIAIINIHSFDKEFP